MEYINNKCKKIDGLWLRQFFLGNLITTILIKLNNAVVIIVVIFLRDDDHMWHLHPSATKKSNVKLSGPSFTNTMLQLECISFHISSSTTCNLMQKISFLLSNIIYSSSAPVLDRTLTIRQNNFCSFYFLSCIKDWDVREDYKVGWQWCIQNGQHTTRCLFAKHTTKVWVGMLALPWPY